MKRSLRFLSLLLLLSVTSMSLHAQNPDSIKPRLAVTHHSIKIDGRVINYTATAGTLVMKNEKDTAIAEFGFVAYVKDGEGDASKRPVTFSYNGGPGSSSMWLHMGIMGPRRVVIKDPENAPQPPYKIEDNNFSPLNVTDIVMMDPIGTGLSKAVGKAKDKDFWGVDEDIESVSKFIKLYITQNDRWNSPKYLLGESYGTMRSAGAANYLQENLGIALNGIMLVSTVLDLRQLTFAQGDDISYVIHLPTYAAVAYYHNRLTNKPATLEAFLKDVRNYAAGAYTTALMKGDDITETEKDAVATQLAAYTGLGKEYLMKANLRVTEPQFTQELLRTTHESVGRLDARYKGINQNLLSENSMFDPQSSAISPPYIASFLSYYYGDLKVPKDRDYSISAYNKEGFEWNWKHSKNGNGFDAALPNTGVDLAEAMSRNPALRVLVLNGYYDLATPFYGAEYTMSHLGLEKNIRSNIFNALLRIRTHDVHTRHVAGTV